MNNAERFETLDAIRGVAALSVLLYHVTQHTGFPILRGSYFAVDIFFCLSGFVIAHSYGDRLRSGMPIRRFLVLRLIRLWPMFLMGVGIGGGAILLKIQHGETDLTPKMLVESIGLNILYLPYIAIFSIKHGGRFVESPTFPTDDPGWSLSFEFFVNFAFAVSTKMLRWLPITLIIVGSGLALVAYVLVTKQATPGWGRQNLLGGIPRVFFGFYLGAFVYGLVKRLPRPGIRLPYSLIIAGIITSFIVEREGKIWIFLVLLTMFPAVYFGGLAVLPVSFGTNILKYFGWLSYPLYCIHMPIYLLTTIFFGDGVTASALAIGFALISAHILCKFVDEPARTSLSRYIRSSQKRPSTDIGLSHIDDMSVARGQPNEESR